MTAPFRRKIFALLLACVLLAPWALAGEPRQLPAPDRAGSFSWAPLDLLSRLWSALTGTWDESGCTFDPSGRCLTSPGDGASSGTTGDNGCTIDPNGRCLTSPGDGASSGTTEDNGCTLDPSGRCLGGT